MLDGRTGTPLIQPPMRDSVGAQASAITVSMEGRGNDVFLYWVADCQEHKGEGGEFQFMEGNLKIKSLHITVLTNQYTCILIMPMIERK